MKYTKKDVFFRTINDMVSMIPFYTLSITFLTFLHSLWEGFSPIMLSKLINNITLYINGSVNQCILYIAIYVILFLIMQLIISLVSILENNGIYEKTDYLIRSKFCAKIRDIPLIYFEDANNLNILEKAKKSMKDETIPNIWRTVSDSFFLIFTIAALSISLMSFNFFLFPMAILSSIPGFVIVKHQSSQEFQLTINQLAEYVLRK